MTKKTSSKAAKSKMRDLGASKSVKGGRSYTSPSHIMKTKHDTVKNSVGNIR